MPFGKKLIVMTWGESHGPAIGAVMEGVPSGIPLAEEDIQKELDLRKPGTGSVTSPRKEDDRVKIMSGLFEGKTTGTPISLMIYNKDADSSSYEYMKDTPRPGHADFTCRMKYGHVDWRGGGRASGRETAGRVAAGAVAKKILAHFGITIGGHVVKTGNVEVKRELAFEEILTSVTSPVRCGDEMISQLMIDEINRVRQEGDSIGGIVEIAVKDLPPGLGNPVFDKLDAELARALMSIGGVKGIEIGEGFRLAEMKGSEANDPYEVKDGKICLSSNRSGGILGGISTGEMLKIRIGVKPTPSIFKEQNTVNLITGEAVKLNIKGRHDPCLCPRIVPVAESMVALVIADNLLQEFGATIFKSKKIS